ncbi:MAG TPA: hypothetical protein VF516_10925, partial [Kofleriaceae bacterium]
QLSLHAADAVVGPLPMTDGTGSAAGMNHAIAAQLSLRAPLGAGLQGSFAAYARRTHHAIDFGMVNQRFTGDDPCHATAGALVYRDIDSRAVGVEAMIRRELGHAVTGWLSYSLGKVDRDLGFVQLPGDFDQRHTLSATAQWQRGRWRFGASGQLHTGRPVPYPLFATCSDGFLTSSTSADALRRLPTTGRIDLRAERALSVGGRPGRLFFELQNATFLPEPLGYRVDGFGAGQRVVEDTLLLPLPLVGLEVVL